MEASSSTHTPASPRDVFVNYCGFDVKSSIASTIYHWIEDLGLRVFLPTPDFQSDLELPTPIVDAILGASVHITIFSKKYAECFWCLDELRLILATNASVIPVFYDVRRSDLRCTDIGTYSSAFIEYEKKGTFSLETVSEWKVALNSVADYSGFDLNDFQGDEGKLLKNIVDSVLKVVNGKPDVGIHGRLLGLDQAVTAFDQFLVHNQQFRGHKAPIVGILGAAGSGKTTLARELYHRKRFSFRRSSFLCDVGDSLERFQSQLLKDLAGIKRKFYNTSESRRHFKHYLILLAPSRVLVVLDGIEHKHHLDALLSVADVWGQHSLIIVTSPDPEVHKSLGIRQPYELKALASHHAEELFCYHAFQQRRPIDRFGDLVGKALSKCEGSPLFIKLMSGHLSLYAENNEDDWEEELGKIGNKSDILEVSYDALWEVEKQIFLDIACFFVGEDRNLAMRVWDESGWRGSRALKTLEYKSLVEVNGENRLQMHDCVRDFGRAKASEQSPRRIWSCDPALRIAELLEDGTEVRGIVAAPSHKPTSEKKQSSRELLEIGQTSSVSLGLKLLLIKGDYFERTDVLSGLSKDLVWLRCHVDPHKSILRFRSSMEHLRVLQVTGHHTGKLWQGEVPRQLRELHCEGNLGEVPQSIGSLTHLEKIVLDCGEFICSHHILPEEIFSLKSLQHMEIHCTSLRSLPNRFRDLKSIQWVSFSGCSELRMLPESFGHLTRLQYLSLKDCRRLISEPQSFGEIRTLQHLILENCNRMQVLPTEIRCQGSLTKLDVTGTSLKELPSSTFGITSNLQVLRIGSPFLASLPSSIGALFGLTHLELDGCTELKCLPESLGQLNRLKHLSIVSSGIQCLPRGVGRLTNLEELNVANCPIREMTLNARGCGQENLPKLQVLNINGCSELCALLIPGHLSCLETLRARDCRNLVTIQGLENLPNLRALDIYNFYELSELSIPGHLSCLETLNASNCRNLVTIQGLENLPNLLVLDIYNCSELRELSIPGHLSCLETLDASNCRNLVTIQGLENMPNLRVLDISYCFELRELSIPGHLSCLETLHASYCRNLVTIQGLENMPNLRVLDISNCSELRELSIPGHLSCLETLHASGCSQLQSIQGLDKLSKLRVLGRNLHIDRQKQAHLSCKVVREQPYGSSEES